MIYSSITHPPTHPPTKKQMGADGKPAPTWADLVKLHGPVFVVWWGTLWVVGAGGLFLGFEYHLFGDIDALSMARACSLVGGWGGWFDVS